MAKVPICDPRHPASSTSLLVPPWSGQDHTTSVGVVADRGGRAPGDRADRRPGNGRRSLRPPVGCSGHLEDATEAEQRLRTRPR
jgi:hypothetical protein